MSGKFPDKWIHGAPDCRRSADPVFHVHSFDKNTYILRQSKCSNFEGPFLYLIIGDETAFLIDSGAAPQQGSKLPIRETVESILEEVLKFRGQQTIKLIVGHSHAHDDHAQGDEAFKLRPGTTVIPRNIEAMKRAFSIADWEKDLGTIDLGNRLLTIIPTPGHEEQHICIYDLNTKILFSGDMLYAGKLVINDWPAYRKTVEKMALFAEGHELSFILGAHIEMKNTPRQLYPIGTTFQPDEHSLELRQKHLKEWAEACLRMGLQPKEEIHDDFIIFPAQLAGCRDLLPRASTKPAFIV